MAKTPKAKAKKKETNWKKTATYFTKGQSLSHNLFLDIKINSPIKKNALFQKKEIHMALKTIKECLISLLIMNANYICNDFSPIRFIHIQNTLDWRSCRQIGTLIHCW